MPDTWLSLMPDTRSLIDNTMLHVCTPAPCTWLSFNPDILLSGGIDEKLDLNSVSKINLQNFKTY